MIEFLYSIMDATLGIFFNLSGNAKFNLIFGVFVISAIVSAIIVLITARVVDQKEMKELKAKMAKYQEKIKEAQQKKDLKQVGRLQKEMMRDQGAIMSKSFKPMLYTMIPIILIFTWLRREIPNGPDDYILTMPFSFMKVGEPNIALGWLGWYILCSFPTSTLIKKIFNIEGP
ncbi:MAG: EMC3/TMCO1 family protein [Candidatus Hydrothermarchaeota archaeon]|nr:EMC3/TMCO1 family protein [Candidatus Hydrothermarchaeota archaeon]